MSEPVSYRYRWHRDGCPIAGAEAASYTPVAADAGTTLSCEVTVTNAAGSTSAHTVGTTVVPATTTATTTADAMASPPAGAGWTVATFTGRGQPDPAVWGAYSNPPSPPGSGCWDANHLRQSDGVLNILGSLPVAGDSSPCATGSQFVTGGMQSLSSLTYGTVAVRMRMDRGIGVSMVLLLWPADGSWPPEIDFAEDGGQSPRRHVTATMIPLAGSQVQWSVAADATEWHTWGLRWSPGRLRYLLDGRVWGGVTGSRVPSRPMCVAIQTQAWSKGTSIWEAARNSTSPAQENMQVAWVATNPSAAASLRPVSG